MLDYRVELVRVRSGFDGRTFYGQARAGAIPGRAGAPPMVVLTAQPVLRSGSDVYYELHEWRTCDYGNTWDGPIVHADTLGRRQEPDGVIVAVCDMTPGWHAATRKLLSTGHTVRYRDDTAPITERKRETAYSVYDAATRTWTPWATLQMPDRPDFHSAGAGCTQRLDLPDGTILLPFYFKPLSNDWNAIHSAAVARCSFDGVRLTYLEHGTELTVPEPRGLGEPSVTRFGDRYYLTLRNDVRGYVTSGPDGLHFDPPQPWRFDDGSEIGNYNTQQHWVTHSDGLFLVYTRRGLNNDHVFRHRAPLMMAQVDPERLVLLRETERELVPNRGARLGNFSVCDVGRGETWVVVAEWMQPVGCEKYGSDNTIWAARIIWNRPNAKRELDGWT
jgi:hypothetical protein